MKLPHLEAPVIARKKLTDYLLNPQNQGKADWFDGRTLGVETLEQEKVRKIDFNEAIRQPVTRQ